MRHTPGCFLAGLTMALLAALPLTAQRPPDYLTEEEIQKVRDAQEPNRRIRLFLDFAAARLAKFEQALAPDSPVATDDLTEMIEHYISAIDDATSNLEIALEQGGIDLGKTHTEIDTQAAAFLEVLEKIDKSKKQRLEEFRFTWEDSLEATRELLETAKKIPEGMIPAKAAAPIKTDEQEQPKPGRPTLRKKEERPKPPPAPPPPPRPPELSLDAARYGSP